MPPNSRQSQKPNFSFHFCARSISRAPSIRIQCWSCYINGHLSTLLSSYQSREIFQRRNLEMSSIMNNKVRDIPAGAVVSRSFKSRKPLPKRGQIKSRIAANAFKSIVSVLSKASSKRRYPRRKTYLREEH